MTTPESTIVPITLRPIGIIRSPHRDPAGTPIQPRYAEGAVGRAELLPEYAEGLQDIDGFSHLHVLYFMHRAGAVRLMVKPYLQDTLRGVFATRAPARPNPIGLSIVRLVGRSGSVLHLADVDMLDGTPLLDIKPYARRFDVFDVKRSGWLDEVDSRRRTADGRFDEGGG